MEKNNLERMIDVQSRYCYPNTDVLINKAGITDFKKLEEIDRIQTTYVLAKLHLHPIQGKFDVEHYRTIHKVLFNELYEFAGEFRIENISKGGIPFCRPEFVSYYLNFLLDQMKRDSRKIKSEENLIEFLAHYYSELNLVHPFREGNGRTLREFFREYVLEINEKIDFEHYELDFSMLSEEDKEQHILGCIESARNGDLVHLKQFFRTCLVKQKQKRL